MNAPCRLTLLATAAAAVGLTSCGTMNAVRDATATTHGGISRLSSFSLSDLRPAKIPVVEVREKDLKEMPTGHERALAFQNEAKRKRSFWSFSGPVDFKEPTLPELGGDLAMDGSLLPPKAH